MKINCVIVDDEPIAREIIAGYCTHLEDLQIVAMCGNAMEAKKILQSQAVDILFLDINMPVIDGVSFAKTLKPGAQVIFTTAYKEYATDAFDLAACDYLLKPFSFDRFIIAVDKAMEKLQVSPIPGKAGFSSIKEKADDFIFLKTEGRIYKIMHDELRYAEAQGNYTRVVTDSTVLMPKMPFSAFEELLPSGRFVRTHRSFIINKSKIDHIEGNRVFVKGSEIPIGSNYKENVLKELGF
jgi:DNA-binding LytR/AlgR family response regulator